MIFSPNERFAYIDLSRPVTQLNDFLGTVEHLGRKHLGDSHDTVLVSPGEAGEDDRLNGLDETFAPILSLEPIGIPRLQVYRPEQLQLSLLDRRQPTVLNSTSSFLRAGRRTTRVRERISRPIEGKPEIRTSPLYQVLYQAGLEYDFPDQNQVPIRFSALELSPDPELDNDVVELALVPDPADKATRMLVKQVRLCFTSLKQASRKAAYPSNGKVSINVPFARMPMDVQDGEVEPFIKEVNELLPIRGVMGAMGRRPVTHVTTD